MKMDRFPKNKFFIEKSNCHNFWRFLSYVRDAKRLTKKSAKPYNHDNLTNQRPATDILTNGITFTSVFKPK